MPETYEQRELGGLAKSIDALFSQRPQVLEDEPRLDPRVELPEVGPAEAPDAPTALDALDLAAAASASADTEPDPFEALEAVDAQPFTTAEGDEAPEEEELELLHFDEWEGEEDDAEPLTDSELWSEPEEAESEPGEIAAEPEEIAAEPEEIGAEPGDAALAPTGSDLAKAVDAFLAGHRGAADAVEDIAGTLGDKMALDPLADAVERMVLAAEGDPEDPAVHLAGKILNPAVASRLVQRLAVEEEEERRAEYLSVVEPLGIVMANAFKGVLTDATDARTRRACYDGLIALGGEGRPVIEAMVEDENCFLVQHGVAILGETGGTGSVELVTSALANPDFRVRREALSSLAKLGGEDSGQLVMASLDDPDPTVRAAAAEAAGALRLERALKPILALLEDDGVGDDEKVPVQVQALRALGLLGDPGAVQAIEKRAVGSLFSKPPTEVRVAAYRALHDIGTPHARAVIDKAKEDKDPVVRTTARGLS